LTDDVKSFSLAEMKGCQVSKWFVGNWCS